MEEGRFRRLLHNIADHLRPVDLDNMKYLCSEKIEAGERDRANSARELFTLLQQRDLIGPSNCKFLIDLLNQCDRKDLVSLAQSPREDVVTESGVPSVGGLSLSSRNYKRLLNQLSDEMVAKDIESFKFLVDIPAGMSSSVTTGLQIFDYLQRTGQIGPSNSSLLVDIFNEIHRKDLSKKVESFECNNQQNAPRTTLEKIQTQPQTPQRQPSTHTEPPSLNGQSPPNRILLLTPEHFKSRPAFPDQRPAVQPFHVIDEEDDMPRYLMNNRPRGIALIFSNREFPDNPDLVERFGTEKDVNNLQRLWEKLHFNVVIKENLTAAEMYNAARDYSHYNHSMYDCFVCCILSHGLQGQIYGSDSQLIEIGQITSQFKGNACPSLANKPKLFFVQACRGRDFDRGAQPDAVRNSDEDAMRANVEPNEGHFLMGYATPPGYVSWRSTEHGSWYISHLCDVFATYCEDYDVMTMMVKVNDKVSEAFTKKGYKQCPQPVVSLRRRVFFQDN